MTHRATVLVAATCMTLGSCVHARFYVSPGGSDAAQGNAEHPFATVARAQRAIRELKDNGPLTAPITVTLRGGTHVLDTPLIFTPADSGTAACPVTFAGAPGEKVVLSGGRRISGWRDADGMWEAALGDVTAAGWLFNQLYVNGERRPRARIPNEGRYLRTEAALSTERESRRGFMYSEGDLREWRNLSDALVVVFGSWYNTIHHIDALDTKAREVRFTNPAGRPFSWYEGNLRYYVENVPEALDAPGEWYLDRAAGVLRYLPMPGEAIASTEVIAPAVRQTLVRFQGEPGTGNYVEHIHLENLVIRHTDAYLPRNLFDARQAATVQDAGVLADGVRHCVIESCEVANMGEHGIWFRDDCHDCVVRKCHVHDLGGGGIYIGGKWRWGNGCSGWPGYQTYEDIPHVTEHNVVDNCFVHDGCALFTGAVGIWVGQASHTAVTHNEICDMSYSGISVGWDWSGHRSTSHHNLIENNHIHHIGHRRMNDLAGIYTLGRSPGTILRHNLIHDVEAYQSSVAYCLGAGIYLDQSSGDITIKNNVCYSLDNAGFFLHNGARNQVLNNVFADLRGLNRLGWGMAFTARAGHDDTGNAARHNIVWAPTGKAAKTVSKGATGSGEGHDVVDLNQNLYWSAPEPEPRFCISHSDRSESILKMTEWRELGYDTDSVSADPLFVAPEKHDYRLREDSPARALGIRSIDLSGVGLHGGPAWTGKPDTIRMRPPDPASPFTPLVRLVLSEDYEDRPVGYVPGHVQRTDRRKGAVIEVTDECAATGSRCLKFADAPGLAQAYFPNRVWNRLRFSEGTVRVRLDCMNSAGSPARFWIEIRDWTEKVLKAGPTLTFVPDGELLLTGERRLSCTPGQWYHLELEFEVGTGISPSYRLRFGPVGQPPETLEVPFADDRFRVLTWLGFVALDDDRHSVFYLDNLDICME